MTIAIEQKAEVIKKFLDGTSLQFIMRNTKLEQEQVIAILSENDTTHELLRKEFEKYSSGRYSRFFYKATFGRPKMPEKQRKKLRQVRISDEEMEMLGNPKSEQIRDMLIGYKRLEKFCDYLDEQGISLFPDEWIESEYSKPFWQPHVYKNNFSKLEAFLKHEKLWKNFKGENE